MAFRINHIHLKSPDPRKTADWYVNAFNFKIASDETRVFGDRFVRCLSEDGGMAVNELLMQFQADVLGVPVVRPTVTETTALGAAYAAGLAVGFWEDFAHLRRNWKADKTWEPKMSADQRESLHRGWLKAVQRSFGWEENRT